MNIVTSVFKMILGLGGESGEEMMKGEEQSFWLLSVLCERSLPLHYLRKPMLFGVQLAQRVLSSLVKKHLPQLHKKIEQAIPILAPGWFMCLFLSSLELEKALRLIDQFFYEGPHVLYHVALATFLLHENLISSAEDHLEIARAISHIPRVPEFFDTARGFMEDVTWASVEGLEQHHRYMILNKLELPPPPSPIFLEKLRIEREREKGRDRDKKKLLKGSQVGGRAGLTMSGWLARAREVAPNSTPIRRAETEPELKATQGPLSPDHKLTLSRSLNMTPNNDQSPPIYGHKHHSELQSQSENNTPPQRSLSQSLNQPPSTPTMFIRSMFQRARTFSNPSIERKQPSKS
eukprot:TRINITY_DN3046_c0_g1_i1.p1 TRINITY_DN3046_c0_g1~~TRINITY_DN3046_c0_g1_i1.p1  ORF type:complete len:388 (+),score=89.92 TRINITY_DN3046_c0_g1_i1:121-1164(+)